MNVFSFRNKVQCWIFYATNLQYEWICSESRGSNNLNMKINILIHGQVLILKLTYYCKRERVKLLQKHQSWTLLLLLLYILRLESGTPWVDNCHCNRERLQSWQNWLKMNEIQTITNIYHPQGGSRMLWTLKIWRLDIVNGWKYETLSLEISLDKQLFGSMSSFFYSQSRIQQNYEKISTLLISNNSNLGHENVTTEEESK